MRNLRRRPEANAMAWVDLFSSQRDAFQGLAALIKDSVDNLDRQVPGSVDTGLNWLIQGRTSSCALLDGKRGAGKTTVLATLYHATQSREGFEAVFQGAADSPKSTVEGLVHRLVWLEPIDMEPDPPNFHLMAAILARIERHFSSADTEVDDDWAECDGNPHSAWATPALDQRRKALLKLRQLQAGLAYGWDGEQEAKGGDPETIAGNITLSERARLTVARKLEIVLRRLTEAWGRGASCQPLFILPIDDLDLAPDQCLKLLRLLRMLWIPQLFFLLIGDQDGIELDIHLELSGAMGKLCKDAKPEHVSIVSDEVQSHIDSMASQTLRKLIPPPHRIALGYADPAAAMQISPRRGITAETKDQGTKDQSTKDKTLGELVELIVPADRNNDRARDVLRALRADIKAEVQPGTHKKPRRPGQNPGQTQEDGSSFYTGRLFFKTSLRRLTDFWYALDEIVQRGKQERETVNRLVNLFGAQCRMLIQEDGALSRELESDALSEIDKAEPDNWFIGAPPIRVRSRCQPWLHTRSERRNDGTSIRVIVQRPIEWEFVAERSSAKDPTGRPRRLQPDTCGGLVILHDLLASVWVGAPWWSPWLQQPRDNTRTRDFRVWVFTEITLSNHQVVRLRWPFIDYAGAASRPRTFLDYDKLAKAWILEWLNPIPKLDRAAVLTAWEKLCGKEPNSQSESNSSSATDPDLELLNTSLFGGASNVTEQQKLRIRDLAYEITDDARFSEFWDLISSPEPTKPAKES